MIDIPLRDWEREDRWEDIFLLDWEEEAIAGSMAGCGGESRCHLQKGSLLHLLFDLLGMRLWRRRMLTRNVRFFCSHCHLFNACTMSLGFFFDNVQIRRNWDCLSAILAHVPTNQQTDPDYVRIHITFKKNWLTVFHSWALILSSLLELESMISNDQKALLQRW